MKRKIWVIIFLASLLLPTSAWAAPSATLTTGSGSGNPGSVGVVVPISLASVDGGQVSALQFDIQYDSSNLNVTDVSVGTAAAAAGKIVVSGLPLADTLRVILYGENQTVIGDGTVVNVTFSIEDTAPVGDYSLNMVDAVASAPDATEVPLQTTAGTITVSGTSTTFADVPRTHWAWKYIEALYQEGYVAGCSSDPLLYCPENELTRAEMAVFIVRGDHGADFMPTQPVTEIFGDVILSEWHAKWDHQLYEDGYTSGCSADPLLYCPNQTHLRKESPVYFERMLHGVDFYPDDPTSYFYADVPYGADSVWYSKWVWAAYLDEIIQECEDDANRGDEFYRPDDGTTRAEAACIMAKAKQLSLPE